MALAFILVRNYPTKIWYCKQIRGYILLSISELTLTSSMFPINKSHLHKCTFCLDQCMIFILSIAFWMYLLDDFVWFCSIEQLFMAAPLKGKCWASRKGQAVTISGAAAMSSGVDSARQHQGCPSIPLRCKTAVKSSTLSDFDATSRLTLRAQGILPWYGNWQSISWNAQKNPAPNIPWGIFQSSPHSI